MKLEKTDISATDNLLYGTNFGVTNFSLVEKGFGAILENDGLGVKITTSSRDDSGWLVLFFNDGNSCELLSGPAGVSYTISFEAKSSFPNTVVHVSHRQADWQENQIDFGTAVLPAANQWENFSLTGTLVGTKPTSQGVFFGISSVPENTEINIRNLRLNITQ